MMMSASVMDATDAVVSISHSGKSEAVIAAADLTRKNATTVIAVSNYKLPHWQTSRVLMAHWQSGVYP